MTVKDLKFEALSYENVDYTLNTHNNEVINSVMLISTVEVAYGFQIPVAIVLYASLPVSVHVDRL